jgi:3',5'-cyclic AMP phosphodiesterase CpdA
LRRACSDDRCKISGKSPVLRRHTEFARCYEPTWGRHKSRTRPRPGNHEYETPGASAYFDYFGDAAAPWSPGFYSFDLGSWHIVSLNSNIAIDEPSAQLQWLRRDLSSNRARCTLAFWHHPLFSSGPNGADTRMRPLWEVLYAEGADVVLNGHEHMYERFGPQHPSGRADATGGIRQFTIGTGGAHLGQVQLARPNSEARAAVWGVLKLTLQDAGYTWEFRAVAGESFRDAGSDLCH